MARAVDALRAGDCIGLPTETVYGLAGDGLNPLAVARIFAIKQRPAFDPLILHVAEPSGAEGVASEVPPLARQLIARYWPGPLTLVLKRRDIVPDLVTSGLDTVAVRCPAHPVAQRVLEQFGGPLAAPSANLFGRLSPTTAEAVDSELGAALALVLDGGPCLRGIESTIIDCSGDHPVLLRHGAISQEEIGALIGGVEVATSGEKIKAPGLLAHHYAPRTPLWLLEDGTTGRVCLESDTGWLVWQRNPGHAGPVRVLTPADDPVEAASRLFALLRELDGCGVRRIAVEPVSTHGLGRAIYDRLQKASSGILRWENSGWREIPRID
jgi:L-threonylcarbamoyladenylate synthase